MKSGTLEGKVAIVTGSDSGSGQAIAKDYGRYGADIAMTWFEDEAYARATAQAMTAAGRSTTQR